MKSKWIRVGIGRKINDWLESIDDKAVQELARKNTIVTGGCIVSMLLGETVNDFDVYFRNKETAAAIAKYYVRKFKENPPPRFADGKQVDIRVDDDSADRVRIVIQSAGAAGETSDEADYAYFEASTDGGEGQSDFIDKTLEAATDATDEGKGKPKYRPVFLTENAITLSHKVQIVTRFFGEPSDIHKTYDFVHCTCYWDSNTKELVLPPAALEAILARDLRYMGQSRYPICALVRVRKFIKRGWNITAGQILKIAWDIHRLDLSNIETMRDQLIGVDTAYFCQLIEMLRARGDDKIDGAYLMELIDRIF